MRIDYELFNRETQAIVIGNQRKAVQRMLDYDFVCSRELFSVAAIVGEREQREKFFFGGKEIFIPVYGSFADAICSHPNVNLVISFASFRSVAGDPRDEHRHLTETEQAVESASIKTIVVIAEGIPESYTKGLIVRAGRLNKVIIGPATTGGLLAGSFRIGNTAGEIEDIVSTGLHFPGSVGLVSKSGGLLNELHHIINIETDGVRESIAIGGDRYCGSTFLDHLLRFEKNPFIRMMVMLGEVGGDDEYDVVRAIELGLIKKPLVAMINGTCAEAFKTDVQFGHAGAAAGTDRESALAKREALRNVGVIVPNSFSELDEAVRETYRSFPFSRSRQSIPVPNIPMDVDRAIRSGLVRRQTHFTSTITDERGEELLYGNVPIGEVIVGKWGVGELISQLWFRKVFSAYACEFMQMVFVIVADHGPAVAGAHNAIVATRAGKDLVSSLCSGLLCVGDRFGGAIDGAARMFSFGFDEKMSPQEFVSFWKKKRANIQGIGHKIKSVFNPDKRVELIRGFAKKHFPRTDLLDYALEVEKITTSKSPTLILNVDGCIGVCMVDLLRAEIPEEADMYIENDVLNGLFLAGRTIGIIGHHIDQKRLDEGLYRHPIEDIYYDV